MAFPLPQPNGDGKKGAENVKRERSWLVALAIAGAMVLGLSGTSSAVFQLDDGFSYTQPGAELVMPYDTTEGKETFLVASNIGSEDVSTHWIFWNETCSEEVNFSICLTQNDTVIVDPRNMHGVGPDNEQVGPDISLDEVRGVVTVIAYETDEDCSPFGDFSSPIFADDSIVGAFTFADVGVGYSFGNDAFALGAVGSTIQVPEPGDFDPADGNCVAPFPGGDQCDFEFAIQTFNPNTVEASVVVLTHLEEDPGDAVVPASGTMRFATSFVDTTEIPVSLPDTTVSCTEFYSIAGDIIPETTTVSTSGIIRLQPVAGLTNGEDYLYGIVGQAVDQFGASSSLKVEQVEGSASGAFVDGAAQY